jgi:hypothetical protein
MMAFWMFRCFGALWAQLEMAKPETAVAAAEARKDRRFFM